MGEEPDIKNKDFNLKELQSLEKIIFDLTEEDFNISVQSTIDLFDSNYPYFFNLIICRLIYSSFTLQDKDENIYFRYLKEIEKKEEEITKNQQEIIKILYKLLTRIESQESNYLLEKMIEEKMVDPSLSKNKNSLYFSHHKSKDEVNRLQQTFFGKKFFENIYELEKDDWKLHKKLLQEGVNPYSLVKAIRNDDLEKLQEISSEENFNFNQTIEPSLYEKCSFTNKTNVTLIDCSAFFGALKCFKYLLMNNSNLENTGKFAAASGNPEIIHLCEQNHSTFEGSYEAAIEFHRNEVFHYLYEKRPIEIKSLTDLGIKCIECNNFEILSFLEDEEMKINESIIGTAVRFGNMYLMEHFLMNHEMPNNILVYAIVPDNIDIVKYILDKKDIDINATNHNGLTALMKACQNGSYDIVKLLLKHKNINVNAQNKSGKTSLIYACSYGHLKIIKLLQQKQEVDFNIRSRYGKTAFMYACRYGNIEVVKYFLEIGINYNKKDYYKLSPLMIACRYNHLEIIKLLLEQKDIKVNSSDRDGLTSLMCASFYGHIEVVKLLLEQKGINVNAKSDDGLTSIDYARNNGHTDIVNLLEEYQYHHDNSYTCLHF